MAARFPRLGADSNGRSGVRSRMVIALAAVAGDLELPGAVQVEDRLAGEGAQAGLR